MRNRRVYRGNTHARGSVPKNLLPVLVAVAPQPQQQAPRRKQTRPNIVRLEPQWPQRTSSTETAPDTELWDRGEQADVWMQRG